MLRNPFSYGSRKSGTATGTAATKCGQPGSMHGPYLEIIMTQNRLWSAVVLGFTALSATVLLSQTAAPPRAEAFKSDGFLLLGSPNREPCRPKSKQPPSIKRSTRPSKELSSEADLGKTFSASRMTVNRALRELQLGGILDRRAGSGSYVRPEIVSGHTLVS